MLKGLITLLSDPSMEISRRDLSKADFFLVYASLMIRSTIEALDMAFVSAETCLTAVPPEQKN